MSKPILALDMDNTITKLSPHFIQFLEYKLWGDKNIPRYLYPELNEENITATETETLDFNCYKYYELDKYFPGIPKRLFEKELYPLVFGSYNFWITIPPMGNIYDAIRVFNDDFELYIVTHPYRDMAMSRLGKLYWIRKYLPFIRRNQIIFDDKMGDLSKYDILIDDNPKMLQNAKSQGLTTVKVEHGYNKDVKTDRSYDLQMYSGWDRMIAVCYSDMK